jgi:iron complex transport system substrate-binding protein
VFAALPQLAPPVSLEAVIAADPEVIVSTDDTIADPMAMWRRWDSIRAVRNDAVYPLPADTMARATPRLVEGTRATCAALDAARR